MTGPTSAPKKVREIYRGRVVKLDVETVTLPNGATVELEIIRHPGAAAVVPLKDDGAVFLIRQYRHATGGYIYEIPAGKLDPGEEPRHCAARELEEEIGYRAASLTHLLTFFTTPGFTDEVIHIFLATGLLPGTQRLEQDEVLEVVEMSLDAALAKINDGTIRDGKTIVGLQAAYLRRTPPAGSLTAPAIRALESTDRDAALAVVNTAARWYREFLPAGEYHDPEMSTAQWEAEARRLTWYGAFVEGRLVGVMGLEYVQDAALLRHAYILPESQRQGVGSTLREHLESRVQRVSRIIVGTYARNYKARKGLEKAGYTQSANSEAVLRTYYNIPEDRLRSSVAYEKSL